MSTPSRTTADPRVEGLKLVGFLIVVMWLVEVVDALDSHRLDRWGIEPREADGLVGIVAGPFLHASFPHLIGNTIPFAVLGAIIAFGGVARVIAVSSITGVVSGAGTWLVAPSHTVVVGASGVVFGYAAYLIARGFFARSLVQIAVGVAVVGVFGAALLSSLIPQQGISWQAHLFGAIGGVLAARLLAPERAATTAAGPRRPALTV